MAQALACGHSKLPRRFHGSPSVANSIDGYEGVKLSVVDQSPISTGHSASEALQNTIELARLADELGYHRYWIAEHHATAAFASPAPEVLIARVAAETSSIRVGSGGVMLPHYSPMKVVEQFKVLHALYPDRIDLGLGRAPGGSPLDSFALRRERENQPKEDDFPRQLMELLAFLNRGFRPDHPFSRIELSPEIPGIPEVWLLGSSMWSAAAAAQVGLPYAFAHFIDPNHTRQAIEYYRTHFKPSERLDKPVVVWRWAPSPPIPRKKRSGCSRRARLRPANPPESGRRFPGRRGDSGAGHQDGTRPGRRWRVAAHLHGRGK